MVVTNSPVQNCRKISLTNIYIEKSAKCAYRNFTTKNCNVPIAFPSDLLLLRILLCNSLKKDWKKQFVWAVSESEIIEKIFYFFFFKRQPVLLYVVKNNLLKYLDVSYVVSIFLFRTANSIKFIKRTEIYLY